MHACFPLTDLPTVHNTTGSITTTEGSSVQLTCSFDTNCPPLRLTWTKYSDSQPSSVDCSGRFSCGALQSPSTLTITPVSRHDEGEYACQVSNEVGSSLGPKTWLHVMCEYCNSHLSAHRVSNFMGKND